MVVAEDVRRLMESDEGSVLVFVGGKVRVVGVEELASADELHGAMRVASRADLAGRKPNEGDYEDIAAELSTMVSTLGA